MYLNDLIYTKIMYGIIAKKTGENNVPPVGFLKILPS